jgi:hypothetical protein
LYCFIILAKYRCGAQEQSIQLMTRGVHRSNLGVKCLGFVMACWLAALLIGSRAASAQSYKVDAADSQSLTTYLKQHRLPLVGAQVLSDNSGNRRIVLYGFVATEFGKNDAAAKALAYVKNEAQAGTPTPQIDNRIMVQPELARMKSPDATTAVSASANESFDQVLNDIDRFGVTMAPESNPQ